MDGVLNDPSHTFKTVTQKKKMTRRKRKKFSLEI